jgi:hypothetical protein
MHGTVGRLLLTVLLAFLVGVAACGSGSEPMPPGDTATLRGHVYDASTGLPVSGAVARIAGRSDETDSKGVFLIDGIPLGRYLITVTYTGQTRFSDSLFVFAPGIIEQNFPLQATAAGPVTVTIESPGPRAYVDAQFGVSVTVSSEFQLSEVTARVGDVSSPLTPDLGSRSWRATISLAALPSPADYVLVVTARDIHGAIGSSSQSIVLDRLPVLTVAAPATGALAGPVLSVDVSCTDDDPGGCHGIEIRSVNPSGLVTSSQGPRINQGISLAGYEGQQLTLEFSTRDDIGHETTLRRIVVVESTPGLSQVAAAGSGFVVDADADRLLVVNPGVFGIGYDTLRLVDRSSGDADTVFTADSTLIQEARLTPTGAIFVTKPLNGRRALRELRNGSLIVVSSPISFDSLYVDGPFAVWTEEVAFNTRQVVRRDLLAGTNVVIPQPTADVPLDEGDPAPDGDVAVSGKGDVFRFSGGSIDRLTQHPESGPYNFHPRTDGVHVVYLRSQTFYSGPDPIETVLHDGGSGTVLASDGIPAATYSGVPEFHLRGGWIAFVRAGIAQVGQVWLRSPAGVETQVSQFGVSSGIAALSDAGDVVIVSSPTAPARLYRAAAAVPAHDIGSALNRPIYIDGALYLMAGAFLLRVN